MQSPGELVVEDQQLQQGEENKDVGRAPLELVVLVAEVELFVAFPQLDIDLGV